MALISFLMMLPGAFLAPVIHEFTKARVSTVLGDPTPRKNGFLTFNPFKFFEPIGFFFMLAFRVGWGQPVPISSVYFKDKRKGLALTYSIPIFMNLLVGLFVLGVWRVFLPGLNQWQISHFINGVTWPHILIGSLNEMFQFFAICNIGLAVFNLIPIYPMAGNKLLQLVVSPETSLRMNHYEKPMQIILILMLVLGVVEMFVGPFRLFFMNLVWF